MNKLRFAIGFCFLFSTIQMSWVQSTKNKSCYELEDYHICPDAKVIRPDKGLT